MNKYQEAKEILELYDYSTKLELSEGFRNGITENISVSQFMQMKEICLELLDKATPTKPIGDLNSVPHYRCPNCNSAVKVFDDSEIHERCGYCNQAIDWSNE